MGPNFAAFFFVAFPWLDCFTGPQGRGMPSVLMQLDMLGWVGGGSPPLGSKGGGIGETGMEVGAGMRGWYGL